MIFKIPYGTHSDIVFDKCHKKYTYDPCPNPDYFNTLLLIVICHIQIELDRVYFKKQYYYHHDDMNL